MSFIYACDSDQVVDEVPYGVVIDGHEVAIVRSGGKLFAIRDECSHASVGLSDGGEVYPIENGGCAIECGAHGASFDLATGEALELPATKPVPVYAVREVDGSIEVDLCLE